MKKILKKLGGFFDIDNIKKEIIKLDKDLQDEKIWSDREKSLNISKFKEYIQKKSEINGMLFSFYEKYIFRKLRLQSYRNTKWSEQKMLNNFKRIFGNEKDVIVCFGDYEQKKQMKFKWNSKKQPKENVWEP